jgi:hypothetical protein
MLVAGAVLALLLVAAGWRSGNERRPLDRHEMQRVRRFSERLRKESTFPFD